MDDDFKKVYERRFAITRDIEVSKVKIDCALGKISENQAVTKIMDADRFYESSLKILYNRVE